MRSLSFENVLSNRTNIADEHISKESDRKIPRARYIALNENLHLCSHSCACTCAYVDAYSHTSLHLFVLALVLLVLVLMSLVRTMRLMFKLLT